MPYIWHFNIIFFCNFRKDQYCKEKCLKNSHCDGKEVCRNGECQSGCTSNDHCKQGETCRDGKCLKSCKSSQECQQHQYCHIDDKVCYEKCSNDSNCTETYTCFEGECLTPCSLSTHCKTNQYCDRYSRIYNIIFNVNVFLLCKKILKFSKFFGCCKKHQINITN